jgi:DNA-binding NarL/FixJ family response regulator
MTDVIRILLADDHAVVREGLRALLDQHDDFEVVGEVGDGDAALREAARLRPTLVLMDMKMPGPGAVETIRRLKQNATAVQILVFTSYAEDSQVRDALEAGALGYLLKDALREDLVRAVRAVASGLPWLHPQAQRQLLEWMRRPPSPVEALTARERSVLVQLAEGRSNKLIARSLKLTEGTVKGYVSQVLDKLGVADRTQAALLAHKEGLLR